MPHFPLIRPQPPRLSELTEGLRAIEDRQIFSNGGPVVRQFERDVTDQLFAGRGASLAVSSATSGLILALRHGVGARAGKGFLALVPALTFAATAHAAMWAGLVPLIHDVDAETWCPAPSVEEDLLRRYAGRVAAIVPYATFGRTIDLERYAWLSRRHDLAVVIDAAASLGTLDADGANFGAGTAMAVVYSMHATKTFATSEGGLVHSGDMELIDALRQMTNFGFGAGRSAVMPGLNAKLSEISGLLASAKLAQIDAIASARAGLADAYRAELGEFAAQAPDCGRQCFQFWSMLLPPELAPQRADIIARLASDGVGAGTYFSPHLGQQPFFQANALIEPVPVADDLCRRIVSLPITDDMTRADVRLIAKRVRAAVRATRTTVPAAARAAQTVHSTVIVGGGPAGTALLTAATKQNRLTDLASSGLVVIDQAAALGGGQLGQYAIRSDSTAETFLSAVRDNVHPSIAALADHPAGMAMARHIGALGAPLTEAGDLLAATGQRLGQIVTDHGGSVMTGHAALSARRTAAGLWATRVLPPVGAPCDVLSRTLVIATGGMMQADDVRAVALAGTTLGALAGDKLMLADDFLRLGSLDAVHARLADLRAPRIVIVGGSTSALTAAVLMLKGTLPLGAGAITVMHRRPLRPFYPSRAAALADGFTDFDDQDICPVSGFVYRLAGFRLEARDLVLRALEVGGRVPDPRFALFRLDQADHAATRATIDRADLVIGATGYRPRALPLFDVAGAPIPLACQAEQPGALVDRHCRVIAADGSVVEGAFGIGLAAGFVPWGPLGGEPSFRGKANGLWLWQNAVGAMILDQVMAPAQAAAVA